MSSAIVPANELSLCDFSPVENEASSISQGLNPENIAFLNWNIYKGSGESWQRDLTEYAKSHDLLTIQEAMLDKELISVLQIYHFSWVMNTAFHLNGTATGVMTAAVADSVASCGFKTGEPFIQIPKSALISYYTIMGSDKRLLVANIHGINFTLGLSVYRQQLDALYNATKYHDGPMIVAGDFNSWSEGRMLLMDEFLKKLSLSSIEYSINNKTHYFGYSIDHIFYRQLELISNQVWQVSSSDHNPISVTFRYYDTELSQPAVPRVSVDNK